MPNSTTDKGKGKYKKDKLGRKIPLGFAGRCVRCFDVFPIKHECNLTYCGHCYKGCPRCDKARFRRNCEHNLPWIKDGKNLFERTRDCNYSYLNQTL